MGKDLFFVRSDIVQWCEVLIYSCIYSLAYYITSKIKRKNAFSKLFIKLFYKQYFANMISLLFAIIMDLGFSASATLATKQMNSKVDLLNYISALLGMIISIFIITVLPLLLYFKKKDTKIDTEDAYLFMSRSHKLS